VFHISHNLFLIIQLLSAGNVKSDINKLMLSKLLKI